MDFKELCAKRASVRDFDTAKEISREDMEYVIECARYAPSACNRQPWRLVVMESEGARECAQRAYTREWLKGARAIVAVVADHGTAWHREAYDNKDHTDVDASIITEHVCLAAAERGIGTCWICAFDPEVAKKIEALNLKEGEELIALVAMGYPKEESVFDGKSKEERRKKICEFVEFV